ncbi:MAG: 30S ribosome-binding factor RbfA [bacterium]|nr:30S ribosome-binding factor RbfA [bacterium]
MAGHYKKRLESHIMEVLTELLERETRDPRVEGVVVTAVEINHDFSVAKVFFMGGEEEEALTGLKKAGPFLRGQVGRYLKMKTAPLLRFHEDTSLDQYNRVEDLLDDSGNGDETDAPAPDPKSDTADGEAPAPKGEA